MAKAYTGYYTGSDPAGNKHTTGQYNNNSFQGAYNSNGGSYNNYGESMGTRDTTRTVNPYVPETGGGGGGGSGSSGFDYSTWFNYMMGLADKGYNAMANAYRDQWKASDDQARRSSLAQLKELNRLANSPNGRWGNLLSNRTAVYSNRDEAMRENKRAYDSNLANALMQRNNTLFNMTSMLPQMDPESWKKIEQNIQTRYL